MNKNIRELILEAMNTDDSFNENNLGNINKIYLAANNAEKELINNLFINLCGYSLETLISYTQLCVNQRDEYARGFNEINL